VHFDRYDHIASPSGLYSAPTHANGFWRDLSSPETTDDVPETTDTRKCKKKWEMECGKGNAAHEGSLSSGYRARGNRRCSEEDFQLLLSTAQPAITTMASPLTIPSRTLGSMLLAGFCPRCFWIQLHFQNKLPFQMPFPGIFSSIDGYTKGLIHSHFDKNGVVPSWFPPIGDVSGYVPSHSLHWSKFKYEDPATNILLRGTPDDVFQLRDGSFHIVDYKTAKATEAQDQLFPLYEVQLNVYALIGEKTNQFRATSLSLLYFEPLTGFSDSLLSDLISDEGFQLRFSPVHKEVVCQADKLVPQLLRKARSIYDGAGAPRGRDNCRNCELLEALIRGVAP